MRAALLYFVVLLACNLMVLRFRKKRALNPGLFKFATLNFIVPWARMVGNLKPPHSYASQH